METCGFCDLTHLREACRHLNCLLFDIKCMDDEKHKKLTGASNKTILGHFDRISSEFDEIEIYARTPVIPGFNDTKEEIEAILHYLKGKPHVKYELLPFHRFGQPKYRYLDREFPMGDDSLALDNGTLEMLQLTVNSIRGSG